MTKSEFVTAMATKMNSTKKNAESALTAFFEVVEEALVNNQEINFIGFGKFSVVERKPRLGRNVATGETIQIPATKHPVFKFGKPIKEAVKNS